MTKFEIGSEHCFTLWLPPRIDKSVRFSFAKFGTHQSFCGSFAMEIILTIQKVLWLVKSSSQDKTQTDVNMVRNYFSLSVLPVGMWEIYKVYKFKSFKVLKTQLACSFPIYFLSNVLWWEDISSYTTRHFASFYQQHRLALRNGANSKWITSYFFLRLTKADFFLGTNSLNPTSFVILMGEVKRLVFQHASSKAWYKVPSAISDVKKWLFCKLPHFWKHQPKKKI